MIQAVLIDLDDTLLDNKMEHFLPAYFQSLGGYLSDRVEPDKMLVELLAGTQEMLVNLDPTRSLERAFSDHFYPAIGYKEESLREHLEMFYRQVFPGLKDLTAVRPEARTFIDALLHQDMDIAIATNPLFPRLAVEERLRWAGTPAEDIPFAIITSFEEFHFAKPHPEYYAEILGRLGVGPQDAVMIGNDPPADLEPAQRLGIDVFHLAEQPDPGFPGGDFEQALTWLAEEMDVNHRDNAKSPAAILARARGHLAALITMLKDVEGEIWSISPQEGEWSLGEIICHLRDVESEVHLERLSRMLTEDNPHLVGEDTDAWAEQRDYHCQPAREAFDTFIQHRIRLIDRLATLAPVDWSRNARHTLLGPIQLREVIAIANDHDTIHLAQVRKTLDMIP